MALEPYREAHVEGFVVRWVLAPCLNPLCDEGVNRHGIVSVNGDSSSTSIVRIKWKRSIFSATAACWTSELYTL